MAHNFLRGSCNGPILVETYANIIGPKKDVPCSLTYIGREMSNMQLKSGKIDVLSTFQGRPVADVSLFVTYRTIYVTA